MYFTNMYCKKETSTNYLGVTIQTDLTWHKHVNNITASATQKLNFIKRNLRVNSKTVRDRPFNLQGWGVWFFVSFRNYFSD